MGFLDIFKKKKPKKKDRATILAENAGQPFSCEIPEGNNTIGKLKYSYTDVKCTIIGDVTGLRKGSVLYTRREGKLGSCAGDNVAQIDNVKIRNMIDDFYDKNAFSTVTSRVSGIRDDYLFINIGFYRSGSSYDVEEDDDEIDEDEE